MRTLDCKAVAARHLEWARAQGKKLKRRPRLAAVLYRPSGDAASVRYRDLVLQDARALDFEAVGHEAADEAALLGLIERLNGEKETTGVVVLYPLRAGLPDEEIMDRVSAGKDVEGLHSLNLGYLIKYKRFLDEARGIKCVVPATAKGVVKTLQFYPEIGIEGRFATIVNNSMRVGKPLGLMLENLGATVVKCYDRTPADALEQSVRRADILITAVPAPDFRIDPSWVRPGAVVVDVSYQGNIDARALEGKAAWATAADNRVGQVTRAMMLVNLVYCGQVAQ